MQHENINNTGETPHGKNNKSNISLRLHEPPKQQTLSTETNHPTQLDKQKSHMPNALILSDSILRGTAPLIKASHPDTDIRVLPGAKIQDGSRYMTNTNWVPDKIIFNIRLKQHTWGTNNQPHS